MTGGIYLLRKYHEYGLKLEFCMTINPACIDKKKDQEHIKNTALKANNLELIYFKIRNQSKISLFGNRIWVRFDEGFEILDEERVNNLETKTPLGTLQGDDIVPLIYRNKPPTFDNLIWGKGKAPTLHTLYHAYYDPDFNNITTILRRDEKGSGDLFIPIWVETPSKRGKYKVEIIVKPSNIDKVFEDELTIEVI